MEYNWIQLLKEETVGDAIEILSGYNRDYILKYDPECNAIVEVRWETNIETEEREKQENIVKLNNKELVLTSVKKHLTQLENEIEYLKSKIQ